MESISLFSCPTSEMRVFCSGQLDVVSSTALTLTLHYLIRISEQLSNTNNMKKQETSSKNKVANKWNLRLGRKLGLRVTLFVWLLAGDWTNSTCGLTALPIAYRNQCQSFTHTASLPYTVHLTMRTLHHADITHQTHN